MGDLEYDTEVLYPTQSRAAELPEDIPCDLRHAYAEAWSLTQVSEAAAALMARRCLQLTLRKQGFVRRTLDAEIDEAAKVVGSDLAAQLHYVRKLGNISAHPIDAEGGVDFDSLLRVDKGEVDLIFQAIRDAFDEFFVKPARNRRAQDALDDRLSRANSPAQNRAAEGSPVRRPG